MCPPSDGMAAVLGHEVAHQLARHSAEKLSFAKIIMVLQLTLMLFGIDPSYIFNQLATNFLMTKPFSRRCETEADEIGLQLMAKACYNPEEAVNMWRRMERAGGANVPQFMSTHPSHKNRIAILEKEVSLGINCVHPTRHPDQCENDAQMPDALAERASSDCTTELKNFADMFNTEWVRW